MRACAAPAPDAVRVAASSVGLQARHEAARAKVSRSDATPHTHPGRLGALRADAHSAAFLLNAARNALALPCKLTPA